MDGNGKKKSKKSRTDKCNLTCLLRKAWCHLRLSVRHPARVPTWDAIVLTAASPDQAQLYDWHLSRAKRMGHIASSTVTLTVPDPGGSRIGSGAGTLHALSALGEHLLRLELDRKKKDAVSTTLSIVELLAKSRILLLHAGGDSKRVPWANPMGKVFLPLPYLASDNPDGAVPLLFDHILAISSCASQAFKNKGGIFMMTGDVLPCFDASTLTLPDDSATIVTVPITLDVASNHGVIVASKSRITDGTHSVNVIENLLQKPNVKELTENNAIGHDGRALLDTGIIAVRGKAWVDLLTLASKSKKMITELLETRKEMSLYEDLVAAWVPARYKWLIDRPLGKELIDGLSRHRMFSYCADSLLFLHFGTSAEVLEHLSDIDSGLVSRRHLCTIPETTACDIAASALILSSKISAGVSIGEDSLVYESSLSGKIQVGSQSIIVGVNISLSSENVPTGKAIRFVIPDRTCLWEVPLKGFTGRVLVFCGLHDNPKTSFANNGTFCGKSWETVLHLLGIKEYDLWNHCSIQDKCLWNAKMFPILPPLDMLNLSMWLMDSSSHGNKCMLSLWRDSRRVSLEELHRSIDFSRLCTESSNHIAELAAEIASACINYGMLGRNLSQLCEEILQKNVTGVDTCKKFLSMCSSLQGQYPRVLPQSRLFQVQVDLHRACGDEESACFVEQEVWAAVADETASSVKYGFSDKPVTYDGIASAYQENVHNGLVISSFQPQRIQIDLPVRVDFVGGWSDTPPWSLERPGCVLNMAINLDGSPPISAVIETTESLGIFICDDSNKKLHIKDPISIYAPFDKGDPFRLVKSALLVTGVNKNLLLKMGLSIKTSSNVPRGSGLGTSSILAAAVVKGLLQLMKQDDSNENVAKVVLVLEQIMGTGGGWQDQTGGLYPGIKCTSSFPEQPLRLQVGPLLASPDLVLELEQRLLVVFTGQVRLAHDVLKNVVSRYLRRDYLLISSIKRLATLAKIGRETIMNGDIDELGEIMLEAWRLQQELDPYCSNELVDSLFNFADPYCSGYKLVGAGGGGFALLLTKDKDCALELRQLLTKSSEFNVKVYNWSICLK